MNESIRQIVEDQTKHFRSGLTRDLSYRLEKLEALEQAICNYEDRICVAMMLDLGKSKAESYMTEISMVLGELRYIKKHLRSWAKPKRVPMTLGTFPSKSYIYSEPYGVSLILAPWNYPFLLAISPLVGALAAGNCVVLKCSKSSINTARTIKEMIESCLPEQLCYAAEPEVGYDEILNQDYQYIFFTGSPRVGKQIMEVASKRLIPVSLELGGKSPCIVTDSADIKLAARRIVWGKLLNAGQTCISIDYILVDTRVKQALIAAIMEEIALRYDSPATNPNFPSIISDHHYNRLMNLIDQEFKLGHVIGGVGNPEERKMSPAIITEADWDHPIMEEEIFGPILPIIAYEDLNQAVNQILDRPHPLASYIFTNDQAQAEDLIKRMPFGGGCVNDTIMHISNHHMPFGGVGNSGMGGYHGYYSFRTFTHEKSMVWGSRLLDLPIRYAPLDDKKYNFIKKFL